MNVWNLKMFRMMSLHKTITLKSDLFIFILWLGEKNKNWICLKIYYSLREILLDKFKRNENPSNPWKIILFIHTKWLRESFFLNSIWPCLQVANFYTYTRITVKRSILLRYFMFVYIYFLFLFFI